VKGDKSGALREGAPINGGAKKKNDEDVVELKGREIYVSLIRGISSNSSRNNLVRYLFRVDYRYQKLQVRSSSQEGETFWEERGSNQDIRTEQLLVRAGTRSRPSGGYVGPKSIRKAAAEGKHLQSQYDDKKREAGPRTGRARTSHRSKRSQGWEEQ